MAEQSLPSSTELNILASEVNKNLLIKPLISSNELDLSLPTTDKILPSLVSLICISYTHPKVAKSSKSQNQCIHFLHTLLKKYCIVRLGEDSLGNRTPHLI